MWERRRVRWWRGVGGEVGWFAGVDEQIRGEREYRGGGGGSLRVRRMGRRRDVNRGERVRGERSQWGERELEWETEGRRRCGGE